MIKRWSVHVTYNNSCNETMFYIEELEELHDIIEATIDFTTIKEISIQYNLGKKNAG